MTSRCLILNVVGLTKKLLEYAPHLKRFADQGAVRFINTVTPAVTTSVQSTLLTGVLPQQHGIVANGWYNHELAEVQFWKQSNHLVNTKKVWEYAKQIKQDFSCAQLFWWYNMYSSADISVTPRPMYPADGRKIPDIYTHPSGLREKLNNKLGAFPLFNFWGPTASIESSRWIADCAAYIEQEYQPDLNLVYLPHLDYNLQRLGPDHEKIKSDVIAIDKVCCDLLDMAEKQGMAVIILSEYGVTNVNRVIHINRELRHQGWISVREELGLELLDPGASDAFAVADHQIAHIYIKNTDNIAKVREFVTNLEGIEKVYTRAEAAEIGLDHPRSGDLIVVSRADAWFCYYYWLDDVKAPDFARTVDIHRKPGYDPLELFVDPKLKFPKFKIALRLLQKVLGMRYLMDVIPLEAGLVKGSHGRPVDDPEAGPLIMSNRPDYLQSGWDKVAVEAVDVKDIMLKHLFPHIERSEKVASMMHH